MKMKKIICALMAGAMMLVSFAGCGGAETEGGDVDSSAVNNNDSESTTAVNVEEIAPEERLSATCDTVLAEGKDFNGDYYELVYMQDGTAATTIPKVGVIRNNEWLVPLSENHPFVKSGDSLVNSFYRSNSGEWRVPTDKNISEWKYFEFIGNGCFYGGWCFYNALTQKSYVDNTICFDKLYETTRNAPLGPIMYFNAWAEHYTCYREMPSEFNNTIIYRYGNSPWEDGSYSYKLLDLSTMKAVPTKISVPVLAPYSEGLVLANNYSSLCFMDKDGKIVIDLSEYNVATPYSQSVFIDGKCTFIAENSGKYFKVTIDKTGKVLSEEPWDKTAA